MPPPVPVIRAALATSGALRRAADRLIPGEVHVLNQTLGFAESQVITTLVELGLADALGDGRVELGELAARVDADAHALHRLLRVAEAMRLVRLHGRRRGRRGPSCSLTARGQVLREQRPGRPTIAPFARYAAARSTRAAWAGLTEAVRSGRPAFAAVHGMSTWEWFNAHPGEAADFNDGMRQLSDFFGAELAAAYPWPPGARVCDVAGGIGTLLSHVLAREPSLRGVLVDTPTAIAAAPALLAERGLAERVELIATDFAGPLDAAADVYVLKDVLHDWDDDRCREILARVAAAMAPGARLVVIEMPQGPLHAHGLAPMNDLMMLALTDGGRQRTVAEIDALLAAAGLRRTRTFRAAAHALIEAARGDVAARD